MHVAANCNPLRDIIIYVFYGVCINHADAPRISIYPSQSPYVIDVGTKLTLHCIAKGLPLPTIQWYRNNVSIPQQSSPFYLVSTDYPSTTVYTCEGKNKAGNMENVVKAYVTITVKGNL